MRAGAIAATSVLRQGLVIPKAPEADHAVRALATPDGRAVDLLVVGEEGQGDEADRLQPAASRPLAGRGHRCHEELWRLPVAPGVHSAQCHASARADHKTQNP